MKHVKLDRRKLLGFRLTRGVASGKDGARVGCKIATPR